MLLRTLFAAVLLATPIAASADTPKPVAPPAESPKPAPSPPGVIDAHDAQLFPVVKAGKPIGFAMFSIKPGGRFDQPDAKFLNGDKILTVDDVATTTEPGKKLMMDKLVNGTADAVVGVERKGAVIKISTKAIKK